MHPIALNLLEVIRANMSTREWTRISEDILSDVECHASPEDGCEHCDLYQTMKNLT